MIDPPSGRDGPGAEASLSIDVAFVPSEARGWRNVVCIVVDVLRASSSIVTMLELGCRQVIPMRSLRQARRLARRQGNLLVGERGGRKPPGFDFGNSPAEYTRAALEGRAVVLTTSNGTRALAEVAHAPATLIGCLLNATACCEHALRLAQEYHAGLGVVCAANHSRFALDDAVCAGFLVDTAMRLCRAQGRELVLKEAAEAALRLQHSYPAFDTPFRESWSGRRIIEIGSEEDLGLCARIDWSTTVPVLVQGDPPVLQR